MRFAIRVGDEVQVARGTRSRNPEKGPTRGRVLGVDRRGDRILVEGHNVRVKHLKKSQQHPQGGRLEREEPIAISNVLVITADGDAIPTRHATRSSDGKVVRKSDGTES